MPVYLKCPVISQESITPTHFLLKLKAEEIVHRGLPGMFVMIQCWEPGTADPFLPRAFSICDYESPFIEIFYKTWGSGTYWMSHLKPGDTVQLFGPLGRPFDLSPYPHRVLIGGGTGIAPLVALTRFIPRQNITVILGAKTQNELFFETTFQERGATVLLATEDGSRGHFGLPTEILEDLIQQKGSETFHITGCGPLPMLQKIWQTAEQRKIPCQLAIESPMACGVGACLGCTDPFWGVKTCVEGPVVSNYSPQP